MRTSSLVALLLVSVGSCSHGAPPASLESADAAAYASDYARAKTLYAGIDAKDRDLAQIHLANIEWRIDRNPGAAIKRLKPIARQPGDQQSRALQEWMRAEHSRKHYAEAQGLARRAIDAAKTADEKRNARVSLARTIVEAHHDGSTAGDLHEALAIVKEVVTEDSGRIVPSLLLVEAALLTGDGPSALQGWRSYYSGIIDSPLLAGARRILEAKLPSWHGEKEPELADALASSRLFDAATVVTTPAERPALFRYAKLLRDVTKLTDEYYRDVARGKGNADAWHRGLDARWRAYWSEEHPDGPAFSQEAFEKELGDRFGTLINAGRTGSVDDLHAGHRVIDERRPVEQYGRKATVRFVQLDTMISNGFESWSRDGSSQHGGWGSAANIVQVRPAYADAPARVWRRRTDPALRAKDDEEIAKESAKDWERAARNPYAFLPGLAGRMKRDAELQMIAKAGSRDAFLAAYASAINESSIFAHEGRHAIDDQYEKIKEGAELEYRAKLSEIAFAPDPKLAITSGIAGPGIGDDTPHGQANLRIMKGLVAWMDANRGSIAGLEPARPLLPQLDRLTDNQLRAAARAMDPYAR